MNHPRKSRYFGRRLTAITFFATCTLSSLFAYVPETDPSEPVDTLYLDELRVIGTRIQVPDHLQPVWIQNVDPHLLRNMPYESAAYHLSGNTFSMVRDYGEGNMALVSQRGFSPVHTRIVWEEMPLNHPMLGMFDLSLIPAGLLDGISSSSGNPAAMSGSGGIGGLLSLRSRTHPDRFFLSQSVGSYGFTQTGLGGALHNGSFNGGIRAFRQSGDFDFSYDDPEPDMQQALKRDNNRRESTHLLAHGTFRRNDWHFRSLLWLDDTANDLPGSIFFPSAGRQEDRSARILMQSGYDGWERTWLTATAGWYYYEMAYEDAFTNPADASTVQSYIFQPAVRHAWARNHESHIAAQLAAQSIDANTYPDVKRQQSLSVRWNHSWQAVHTLVLYPSLEWERHSRFDDVLNPALGLTYHPATDILMFRAMAGRNRNNPTYNDLYWQPFGNPDLKPETVYTYEAGATLSVNSENGFQTSGRNRNRNHGRINRAASPEQNQSDGPGNLFTAGFTIFRHDFDDGIRWIAGENGMFAPANVEKLRSQGFEFSLRAVRPLGLFRLDMQYMLTYTDASIRQERFPGDGSVGRQMVYVPEWVHKGILQVDYRAQIWSRLTIQNIDERFTTMDHSSPIDPLSSYTRMDIDSGWELQLGSTVLRGSVGVRNLTDHSYEVISGYPVAPRHYRASVAITLQ
jgi:vitamin B12 transporter